MAVDTKLSPYKVFQQILLPSPEIKEAYDHVQNDPLLWGMNQEYRRILEEGNFEKIRSFVYNKATELAGAGYDIRPDDVRADFEKQTGSSFEHPSSLPQSTLSNTGISLLGHKGDRDTGGGEVEPTPEAIDPTVQKIQAVQEKRLLEEFDAIVNDKTITDDRRSEALEKLFNNIDAEALLKDQYDIVHKHLLESKAVQDALNSKTEDEKKKYLEELQKRKGVQLAQHLEELEREQEEETEEEKNKRRALLKAPSEEESPEQKKQREESLRKEFQDRLARNHGLLGNAALRAVEVFEIEEEYPNIANIERAVLLAQLYAALEANQESQMQNAAIDAEIEMAQAEQMAEMQEAQMDEGVQQQNFSPNNRGQNQRNGHGVGKKIEKEGSKLARKGLEKLGEKGAQTAAEEGAKKGLISTIDVWGPPVLIGLAVLVGLAILVGIVFLIIHLLQNQSTQSEPPVTIPTAKSCAPSSTCKNLLTQMGVYLSGNLSLSGDPYGKAKLTYDTLALITQSPSKFGTLLGLPGKTIHINFLSGDCIGHAYKNGTVNLFGFGVCGTGVARFMLIHELSHEIAFRNPSLYTRFINQFPSFSNGILYWTTQTFPTYNCNFDYGLGPFPGECFADASAEYVVYKTYRNTVNNRPVYFEYTFASYPSRFKNLYNFMGTNIYGGARF